MMSKKASLNMSINAIVMLVMAMALLGLGLTFIRGMMGGATGKLGGAIDAADLSEPPTSEKPVVIDKTVKVKANKPSKVKIGFYNTEDANIDSATPSWGSCKDSSNEAVESEELKMTALSQAAPSGEAIAFEVILTADVPQGTYACQVNIEDDSNSVVASAQFFLEVST